MTMSKECFVCKEEKELEDFPSYRDRKGNMAYLNKCKKCTSDYKKRHYKENRQSYLDKAKAQREKDPEGCKEYSKNYYRANASELIAKQTEYSHTDKGREVRKICNRNYRLSKLGSIKEPIIS